jgi:2,5-diketo-D-gluconate reductase A
MDTGAAAPTVELLNGVAMPALGLGTAPMNDAETERAVASAIESGYRLFDTAENYGNEAGVGDGIRASGIDREDVFVTTKFNAKWHGFEEVQQAFANSIGRLRFDYIDLLLIHWPVPAQNRFVDAWRGMVKLLEDGKVRAIGVSNFKPHHLDRVIEATGVVPHVNQLQLNPWATRQTERDYDAAHGIVTESWSPIGRGSELLADKVIVDVAQRHSRTAAQVVLRWQAQSGLIPIPKSSNPQRQVENIRVFDFVLSDEEMESISALDRGGKGVMDSDRFGH